MTEGLVAEHHIHSQRSPQSAGAGLLPAKGQGWGWLPALSLVGAVGVLATALAYTGARAGAQWAEVALWLGTATIFVPIAARLLSSHASRHERIGLVVVLGVELYIAAALLSPLAISDYDAFLHWRTAQDIARTHLLFQPNPLLPVSPLYPGLEVMTNAVSSMSGLSVFVAGLLVVGVARVVLMLALYLLYERVSDSPRIAGIATILYAANSHFMFFDAAFAYESLALPLATLVLCAVASRRRMKGTPHPRLGLWIVIGLGLAAVVVTHHVTSYALMAFLILWTVVFYLSRGWRSTQSSPLWPTLLGLALILGWLVVVGNLVVSYLAPIFTGALDGFLQTLTRQMAGRQLFQDSTGAVAPLWERIVTLASVGLIGLGLPIGLYQIWRRHRAKALAIALGLAALVYPASQALRFTVASEEVAERATEFAFVGLAFVLALSIPERWRSHAQHWGLRVMFTGALAVVFVGQLVAGAGPTSLLLPGPYQVVADSRSIGPEGIAAAQWAKTYLGRNQRIATDRDDEVLMATYGDQWVVDTLSSQTDISPVFFASQVGASEQAALQAAQIRYLVIDERLSTGLPQFGYYFDSEEPDANEHETPISAAALAKFDGAPGINRTFDSGNIVIYDVAAIKRGP